MIFLFIVLTGVLLAAVATARAYGDYAQQTRDLDRRRARARELYARDRKESKR